MSAPMSGEERPGPAGSTGSAAPDEPKGVRVRAHPGLCEGWGNCHRWAPAVYPLDEEGQIAIHLLDVPPELANDAWRGADACPAQAITVIGERPPPSWSMSSVEEMTADRSAASTSIPAGSQTSAPDVGSEQVR